jgi:hypothetical protein
MTFKRKVLAALTRELDVTTNMRCIDWVLEPTKKAPLDMKASLDILALEKQTEGLLGEIIGSTR